jgi:hypothetical protein
MRVLRGIIETPTLRDDGTLISDDGYDSASGLLLSKNGVRYPAVPNAQTKEQCAAALQVLKDALDEFPFVNAPSLSALSAILTGLVRHLMSIAPLHGFDANSIGTGKSTLADVVSMIATGRRAGAMTLCAVASRRRLSPADRVRLGQRVTAGLRADPLTLDQAV